MALEEEGDVRLRELEAALGERRVRDDGDLDLHVGYFPTGSQASGNFSLLDKRHKCRSQARRHKMNAAKLPSRALPVLTGVGVTFAE